MKVSVSLPSEDVEFLDEYAVREGYDSRSAVMQKAVRLLRGSQLGAAYEEAFLDWEQGGEGAAWDVTSGDDVGGDEEG